MICSDGPDHSDKNKMKWTHVKKVLNTEQVMQLNTSEFLITASLHNNHSLYIKHPPLHCNCPIKIFLLLDVSHYRPWGSLWSSLPPIIWASMSGSHTHPRRAPRADLGAARPLQIYTQPYERQIRKLTFGHCLEATPLSSTLVRWQSLWPLPWK